MLKLTSESTVEPVSVADLRTYLRMESTDSTAEDTMLASFITAARKEAENKTKRALVTTTYQLIFRAFESSTQIIELPYPPLSTASTNVSVTYVEDTTVGASTAVGSTVYTVDPDSEPGRVYPSYGNEWPDTYRDQDKAITVQYVTGYSSSTTPCPDAIKTWIKMRAAQMYEFREPIITGTIAQDVDRGFVDGLLDPYRIMTVAS